MIDGTAPLVDVTFALLVEPCEVVQKEQEAVHRNAPVDLVVQRDQITIISTGGTTLRP